MILYHHTGRDALTGIAIHGLVPAPCDLVSRPHVWLTEQPDTSMSDEDAAFVRAMFPAEREMWERIIDSDDWLSRGGRDTSVALTVNLSPNGSRIAHYLTWAQKHDPGVVWAPYARKWWLYFGTIPPGKIIDGPPINANGDVLQGSFTWPDFVKALAAKRPDTEAA